jgi:DNA polymerase-3 subunit epsilon
MKPFDARGAGLWLGCLALAAGAAGTLALAVYLPLEPAQRASLLALAEAAGPLPWLGALGVAIVCAFVAGWIHGRLFHPLRRAASAVVILATANVDHRVPQEGPAELRALLAAVDRLGDRLREASNEAESRVRDARADVELERNRLAVLMSELPQGVVVCDESGRIQLYNERARRLLGTQAARRDGQAVGYMGLGRSVYALMSREGIEGALARLADRTGAGDLDATEILTVLLGGARVARIRVAALPPSPGAHDTRFGFVLLIDDVTRETTAVERRQVMASALMAEAGSALARMRPALARMRHRAPEDAVEALDTAEDACSRLSAALTVAQREQAELDREARPQAALVSGPDLAALVADALRRIGVTVSTEVAPGLDAHGLPAEDLLRTVRYLGSRLREEFDIRAATLRLYDADDRRIVALGWLGRRIAGATLAAWEEDALTAGGESSLMTLRDLLQRQGAEVRHDNERTTGRSSLRIALPLRLHAPAPGERRPSRPVFYDFNLPTVAEAHLLDASLASLAYTAFDTETTGLDPSGGDEIVSIGAVRILNGRILDDETFDQLIHTTRRIDPAALKIHGIGPAMLRGQPTLDRVLPRFHAFCDDTVLLGHNVAFDLCFLRVKEQALGVRFLQPVLDTLLLSSVLHEDLGDNRLEAIAHRLGIEVIGRHTALGDARVTAEVFLKMVPLLAARGIRTLGEAQRAAEKTRYAGLAY